MQQSIGTLPTRSNPPYQAPDIEPPTIPSPIQCQAISSPPTISRPRAPTCNIKPIWSSDLSYYGLRNRSNLSWCNTNIENCRALDYPITMSKTTQIGTEAGKLNADIGVWSNLYHAATFNMKPLVFDCRYATPTYDIRPRPTITISHPYC